MSCSTPAPSFAPTRRRSSLPGSKVGLRINPECSTQEGHAIYDPCGEKSRLRRYPGAVRPEVLPLLSGLHFHTLCEQDSDALETTLDAVEARFGDFSPDCAG